MTDDDRGQNVRARGLGPWGALAIGVLCAAVFVLAHPPMWGADRSGVMGFPGGDLTGVFWADLAFARDTLAQGALPLWNPWDRGGYPFMADPQSGMFDPVTWVLLGVGLAVGGVPAWLIVLKAVVHYGIAGTGMASFFHDRKLPRWAIAFGTLALLWSPWLDNLKDQSSLWPTAWVGWLLLATSRVALAPSLRRGVWLGAAVGVVVNAGHPPTVFRMMLLVLPWATVLVGQRLELWGTCVHAVSGLGPRMQAAGLPVPDAPSLARGAYVRALAGALGAAALVTAALCAGPVWTTLSVLWETAPVGMDAGQVLASSTEPGAAWGIFAPGTSVAALLVYPGFAVVVSAWVAVLASHRAEALALVALGGLGFVLACGPHFSLLPALAEVPGFRAFRGASNYLALTSLAFVVAGTFGVAQLSRLKGEMRWLGVLAAGFCVSAWVTHTPSYGVVAVLVVVGTAGLVVAMSFAAPHRQARIGWALVGVLAVDLWVAGRPVADLLQRLPKPGRGRALVAAAGDAQTRSVYRIADFGYAGNRVGPHFHMRAMTGHRPALTDRRYVELDKLAQRSSNILRACNVSVVGFGKRVAGGELTRDLRSVRKHRGLFTVEGAWPLAFWTDRVALVDTSPEARVWLRMQRDPSAVLERPLLPEGMDAERWGTHLSNNEHPEPRSRGAQLLEYRADRVHLRIDAPRDGLVVLVESYDAGWVATVDGVPTPVVRANVVFRAVPVTAGEHEIVFEYRPPGVVELWWLWALTAVGLVVAGTTSALRRRRQARRGSRVSVAGAGAAARR